MNKVYKVVWNATLGAWVAVSEVAKSRTKSKSVKTTIAIGVLAAATSITFAPEAMASTATVTFNGSSSCAAGSNQVVYSRTINGTKGQATDGSGTYSTVVGCSANGGPSNLAVTAYGALASTTGDGGTATGFNANAAKWATAMGIDSAANGEGAVAIGAGSTSAGQNAITLGRDTTAGGDNAIAIGKNSKAPTVSSVAVGYNTDTTGTTRAVAIGEGASTNGAKGQSVAIGSQAKAPGDQSVALGNDVSATGNSSVAIGGDDVNAVVNSSGTKFKQITGTTLSVGNYISTEAGEGGTAVGVQSSAKGAFSSALGLTANAAGDASVALGTNAKATGQGALAIGAVSEASKQGGIAIGINSTSTGINSTAIGSGSTSSTGAISSGDNATAIGSSSSAAANGTAIGVGSKATKAGGVAIGTNSVSTIDSGVAGYDPITGKGTTDTTNVWKSTRAAIAVGDETNGITRQMTGLAAGTNNSDAVNVAQLKKVKGYADNLGSSTAANFGGGSKLDPSTGNVTSPAYSINGNTYNNVGDALTSLNQGWTLSSNGNNAAAVKAGDKVDIGIADQEKNLTATKTGNNIRYALNRNLDVDSIKAGDTSINSNGMTITNGPSVTKSGVNAGNKVVSNVGDGALSSTSTDAVNGRQLNQTNQNVTNAQNTADAAKAATDKGLSFAGNSGNIVNKKLGETLTIKGEGTKADTEYSATNLKTKTDSSGNIVVMQDKNAKFESVTADDGKGNSTVLNTAGTTVQDQDGNQATYGAKTAQIKDKDGNSTSTTAQGTTVDNGKAKTTVGADTVTVGQGANPVAINGKDGVVTGLTNTTWDPTSVTPNRAATEGQVAQATSNLDSNITKKGLDFAANSGSTVHKNLGETLTIKGEGTKEDTEYSATNLKTKTDSNGNVIVMQDKNAKFESVTADDGNGNSTVLNTSGTTVQDQFGNTATYGAKTTELKDKDGNSTSTTAQGTTVDNGKTQTTVGADTVTVGQGANPVAINGKDGVVTGLTNTTWDPTNVTPNRAATEGQVAEATSNLDGNITKKGLDFAANSGTNVHKNLGETLTIKGEGTKEDTEYNASNLKTKTDSDGNIVVMQDKNSTFDSITAGSSKLDSNGLVVDGGPSVTKDGIDAAGKQIKNVAAGTESTDAINKDQLDAVAKSNDKLGESAADALGGGAKYDPATNTVSNPTYSVNGQNLNNVGDAITQLDKGWTLTSNTKNGGAIKAGDTVDIGTVDNEKNLTVAKNGNVIQYGLNRNLDVDSVKAGDTKIDSNGVSINNGPSITKNGIDASGKTIQNVGTAQNGTDAINKNQLDDAVKSVGSKGLDFAGNTGTKIHKNLGETLTIKGTGTKEDSAYGSENLKTTTDTDGNVVVMQDKNSKFESVTADDGRGNSTVLNTSGTTVKDQLGNTATYGAKTAQMVDKNGNTTSTNAQGTTVDNGKSKTTVGADTVTVGQGANPVAINGQDGTVSGLTNTQWDPTSVTPNRAATEGQVAQAISNLDSNITKKGLDFSANSGSTVHKNLGETLAIKGTGTKVDTAYSSENLKTKTDSDGNVIVMQDKNAKFESVTADDGNGNSTVLNTSGTTVKDKDGNQATYGAKTAQVKDKDGNATSTNAQGMTVDNGKAKTTVGADTVTVGQGANPVAINGKDGVVTGLTNTTWDPSNVTANRAATEGQVSQATSNLDSNITKKGLDFAANSGTNVHKNLGETLTIKGTGTKADTEYSSENLKTKTDAAGNIVVMQDKNAKFDSVTATDGKGNTTVLNSAGTSVKDKDGNQASYGAKTAEMKDTKGNSTTTNAGGTTVASETAKTTVGADTVTVGQGANPVAINGKDGEVTGLTNTAWDPNSVNPSRAASEGQVKEATSGLDDSLTKRGLNFKANSGDLIHKDLGETLTVKGNGKKADTEYSAENVKTTTDSDGNIVVMQDKNSKFSSVTAGDSVLNNDGLKITNGPSITKSGIDAAGTNVSNVADAKDAKDAVNKGQLDQATQAGNDKNNSLGESTATNLGGGAKYDPATGTISNPVYTTVKTDGTTAVTGNVGDALTSLNNEVVKPITFAGDTGKDVDRKLGQKLSVQGGITDPSKLTDNNIGVVANGTDGLAVKLAKDLSINSVTADDGKGNKSVLSPTGTAVQDPNGNTASYGAQGNDIKDAKGNSTSTTAAGTTVDNGKTQTTVGADKITVGTGANPVTVNGQDGTVSGLTNTKWDPNNLEAGRAATEGQVNEATSNLANKGLDFAGNSGKTAHKNLGETLTIKGEGTKADTEYSAENVKTKTDDNGNVVVNFDKNAKFDSVTAGDSVLNNDGLRITDGPSITKSGVDAAGTTVSNVADAKDANDAVNKGQVDNIAKGLSDNTVQYAKNADGTPNYDKIVAGNGKGTPVQTGKDANGNDVVTSGGTNLSNIANGVNPDDAVNKGQLDQIAQSGNEKNTNLGESTANNLGGGAKYDPTTGQISNPTYTVNGKDASNVGDAISALDQGFVLSSNGQVAKAVKAGDQVDVGTVDGEKNLVVAKKDNTIQYSLNRNLDVDSVKAGDSVLNNDGLSITNGPSITKSGVDAAGTTVSNVADAKDAKDAVNKAQLDDIAKGLSDNAVQYAQNADGTPNYDKVVAGNGKGTPVQLGKDKYGNSIVTSGGTNLSNIANGVNADDAVNKGQLDSAISNNITNVVDGNGNNVNITDQIVNKTPNNSNKDSVFLTYDKAGQETTDSLTIGQTVQKMNTEGVKYSHTNNTSIEPGRVGETNDSSAAAKSSTAIGVNAVVEKDATSSVAVGAETYITNSAPNSAVFGIDSQATGATSVAIGYRTEANGQESISMGHGSEANGDQSISIGTGNIVNGSHAGAFGDPSTVNGNNSYVLGNNNTVSTDDTFVVGNDVTKTTTGSVALGQSSAVTAGAGVAGYSLAKAADADRQAIAATQSTMGAVGIGDADSGIYRQITGLAAGTQNSDAVNLAQLKAVDNKVDAGTQAISNILGGGSTVNADGSISTPTYSVGGTTQNSVADALKALDDAAKNNGNAATQAKSTVTQGDNVVVSESKNADGSTNYEVATAKDLKVNSVNAGGTQINSNGLTFVDDSGNPVANTPSIQKSGIDAGNQKITNVADGTIAKGSKDAANSGQVAEIRDNLQGQITNNTNDINNLKGDMNNGKVGLVQQENPSADVTVAKDTGGKTVNFKGTDGDRQLTGVAAGKVTSGSTDAVNGDQIANISKSTANAFGGDTVVNADGTISTSNVGGTGKNSINDAIASVNANTTKAKTTVSGDKNISVNSSENKDGSTNYAVSMNKDLNVESIKVGNVSIDNNGINAGNQKVSGVADGQVAKDSKDAVNGGQMNQANQNTANYLGGGSKLDANGQVTAPSYDVAGGKYNNVGDAVGAVDNRVGNLEKAFEQTNRGLGELRKDANAGISGAIAIGNLPQPSEPGMSMVSVGLGGYRGEGAVSVGASAITDNNKYIWKFAASADTRSNVGGGVSFGYQWK